MPHTASAKKALRQNQKRRLHNRMQRSSLRTLIRKFRVTAAGDASAEEKQELFRVVTKRLDQAAAKKLIHRNKAARTKSRLSALLSTSN